MTYCLGWKTKRGLILAADAVITSPPLPTISKSTSFHEPHLILPNGKIVTERALKTYYFGDRLILTYTGTVSVAEAFIKTLSRVIDEELEPLEAVKQSLGVNVDPQSPGIGIIFGFYLDGAAKLMSYNISTMCDFDEHEELVQGGSVPESVRSLTENHLLSSDGNIDDSFSWNFAKLLSVIQAYGAIGPLIHTYAGGVFSALGLSMEGVHFQPDILYILDNLGRDMNLSTSVFFRNDCIIAKPRNKPFLCLMNRYQNEDDRQAYRRGRAACDSAKIRQDRARFDFIIFQNSDLLNIVIVEMLGKKKHDLLWIENLDDGTATFMHPELTRMFDGKPRNGNTVTSTVFFLPYKLPTRNCPIVKTFSEFKKTGKIE